MPTNPLEVPFPTAFLPVGQAKRKQRPFPVLTGKNPTFSKTSP